MTRSSRPRRSSNPSLRLWRSQTAYGIRGVFGVIDGHPDAGLVRAWARSWQSRLGTGLEAIGQPSIDLLSVVNRDDEEEDRVVVRVRQRIHCKYLGVGTLGAHHAHADERWTFGRSGGRWALLSIGGDPLAGPLLTAPLIPTPSSDTERLREESLAELASAQKVGDDVALSGLVSADEPPAFALLDLSVVDSRFGTPLIAAELAHLLSLSQEDPGAHGAIHYIASATTWDTRSSRMSVGASTTAGRPITRAATSAEPDKRAVALSQAGKMRRPRRSIARLAPGPPSWSTSIPSRLTA
jgi:hypothetical protein